MWVLTVIRLLAIMLIGIFTYCTLLWNIGRRVPGRLRRDQNSQDGKSDRRKIWIVLIYIFILAFLLISGFLLIKCITRGGL